MSLLDRLKDLISSEEQPAPEAPPEPEPEPVAEPEVKEPEPAPPPPVEEVKEPEPPKHEGYQRMVAATTMMTQPTAIDQVVAMSLDEFRTPAGQEVVKRAFAEADKKG